MANANDIAKYAATIREKYPNLNTGDFVGHDCRAMLRNLATLCDMAVETATQATEADLISVYLAARSRDAVSAVRVAGRIERRVKLGADPFFSPPPHKPPYVPPAREQFDPIATPPAKPPVEAPRVDMSAVRDMIKTEVREGALEPLQRLFEASDKALRGDFGTMLDQWAEGTREALRLDTLKAAQDAASEAVRSMTPTRLEIVRDAAPPVDLGLVHRDTAKVIAALSAGVNVYLYGPAGSGKTTLAEKCAQAFMLKAYYAAKVESEYQLLGFKDAKGETVRTQFREAYEHGGVFLFDELDGSSPSAVVALNMALANGVCPFPDGMIPRHPDFKCIGAGNTKLTGANRQYAGRNQLDAASIDRFAFIEFGYDDELERALATDATWCGYVQAVRAAVADRGLNHLVTPRATYDGCKLLAKGMDWDTVAGMVIYKGLDDATRTQIEQAIDYSKAA